MDPIIDSDWLGCKNEPLDDSQHAGNVAQSWQWREMGINPPHCPPNKTVMENLAEDILVQKPLKIRSCDLPGYPRSTFLMVFSPDGTKVASTHGNHNVYVSELASGKHVRILKGHPRTPWCIAFHPSHPQLIGSGCLGGQVRVWDLSGGSEVWTVANETVIASIAFHPRDQLLVIATFNELYFWDWSQPAPFTKVCTNNVAEKVRYVAFDSLGYKLITGISIWSTPGGASSLLQNISHGNQPSNQSSRRDNPGDSPGARPQDNTGSAQEMIVNSYQNLVQRYDSLVRNYQRLFMARHQLANTPSTNTTDRGTDPMESDASHGPGSASWTSRNPRGAAADDNAETSHRQDGGDSGDGEGSSSRLLNLDVLSIHSNPSRSMDSSQNESNSNSERSAFGSRSSAFQRLNENLERSRSLEQSERTTRLLPNPFSASSHPLSRSSPVTFVHNTQQPPENAGNFRTGVFTLQRQDTPFSSYFLQRRRNASLPQHSTVQTSTSMNTSPLTPQRSTTHSESTNSERLRSRSSRPTMTNSSTQMSSETINESLDLIRDILRDSGTRLLNLITNMSLSTLASVERSIPRRHHTSVSHSDDSESPNRSRPRVRLFNSRLRSIRREILSSESDSDSDQSLEVNLFRTRNPSFQEQNPTTANAPRQTRHQPTNRLFVELNDNDESQNSDLVDNDSNHRFNISVSNNRFRVRSHSTDDSPAREPNIRDRRGNTPFHSRVQNNSENMDTSRPSTSRDNYWIDDPLSLSANSSEHMMPSNEAFSKVRAGVNILNKHNLHLTKLWLRGTRTSMRDLRIMWENLRRRILALHRLTGRQDVPNYFTRGLMERCRLLTNMTRDQSRNSPSGSLRTSRHMRNADDNQDTNNEDSQHTQLSTDSTSSSIPTETEQSSSAATNRIRLASARRANQLKSLYKLRNALSNRRRSQTSYRWRSEDEVRRRSRNATTSRLRQSSRPCRRENARSFELHCTRNEIRMRAMQVLSIMFNMMMSCLEERGLSQLIIHMLKTLKKALALTCLMLMTNRLNRRETDDQPSTSNERNTEHPEQTAHTNYETSDTVAENTEVRTTTEENARNRNQDQNMDSNSTSSWPTSDSDAENKDSKKNDTPKNEECKPSTSHGNMEIDTRNPMVESLPLQSSTQRWSNRLAVQIAAANRNTSATARSRRDIYLESKRQKALHRTNPNVHPIHRRKLQPPSLNNRIPSVRCLPPKSKNSQPKTRNIDDEEPVAGPSHSQPGPSRERESSSSRDPSSSRNDSMNEFEHRVNLFRIAHMHAVRLRTVARSRLRRLQTIRLYTPSSVREMFTIQSNNNDEPPNNPAPELNNRRSFATYRPHILTTRNDLNNREGSRQFESILNNVAVPLVQVNDLPVNESQRVQPQRMPRVHEYLQPIILAQNALVVEEGGGIYDSLMSDTMPAPTHRVQAWDFTTGNTPDIADSSKNVVVQRCRIHNDASIDISKDGRLLVALLPVPRLRNTNHWLGVYSLEWGRLGQCLHTAVLEQSAVSVALSPTARHLAVGLGSRRFTTLPHARNNVFALLYRLSPLESSSRTGLSPIKELEQNWEQGFTSLNCLRWAPQPGQGLVYAINTGQLIIMS